MSLSFAEYDNSDVVLNKQAFETQFCVEFDTLTNITRKPMPDGGFMVANDGCDHYQDKLGVKYTFCRSSRTWSK